MDLGARALAPLVAGLVLVVPVALWTHGVHTDEVHLATRDPAILDSIRATFGAASPLGMLWPVDVADIAIQSESDTGQGYLHTGYVGMVLLVATIVAVARNPRQSLPWLMAGLACAVLALGPGVDGTRPYGWVDDLPGFSNLSLVWRLASGAGLAAALLAALATRGRPWACGLVAGAVLLESVFVAPTAGGVATSNTSPSAVYTALEDAPRCRAHPSALAAHADLWRQTQHGQPITATIDPPPRGGYRLGCERRDRILARASGGGRGADLRHVLVGQSRALQSPATASSTSFRPTGVRHGQPLDGLRDLANGWPIRAGTM